MDEYTIGNLPVLYEGPDTINAKVSVLIETDDTYLELSACPECKTVTVEGITYGALAFDVEDFALITTLLVRQASR